MHRVPIAKSASSCLERAVSTMRGPTSRSLDVWGVRIGCLVVVVCFCLPLFRGLDGWDLQNDEAIYSYAVDRMVEGAGWATPRSSPSDGPFVEKPPLKFWMVAGPIEAGLLPHDERGLRFVDALLGSAAFIYVYLIGVRLAGPICGVVAVLALFTFQPLLFDHGLRSNNMEAALLLCHAGGLYHFGRWVESSARARTHAHAVAAYFVLGFMTKFVAAAFLPLIAVTALACWRGARAPIACGWRDWLAPAAVAVLLIAPWFIYQTQRSNGVWSVMFGQHVYTRFTSALDPQHLEPWNFYFVQTWKALRLAGAEWMVLTGVLTLSVAAWRQQSWLARLVLVWGVLPVVLLSFGTSKLYHYVYPFLPPLGLAAGHAAAVWMRAFSERVTSLREARWPATPAARSSIVGMLRTSAIVLAGFALVLAIWTIVGGRVHLDWDGHTLLRNSSVGRPLALVVVFLSLSGRIELLVRALAFLPLALLLPLTTYHVTVERTGAVAAPLRAIRNCGVRLRASGQVGEGFYNAASRLVYHSYFYYLRRLGRWKDAPHPDPAELKRRLDTAGHQTPVLVSQRDYDALSASAEQSSAAVAVGDGIVVMLPGTYEACVPQAVQAGARQVHGGVS
jgi:hypothetical protein